MSTAEDIRAMGGKVAYGQIDKFRQGWAIIPFLRKPHYWRRHDLTRKFRSLCGQTNDLSSAHPGIKPIVEGDFRDERCVLCQRKAIRL